MQSLRAAAKELQKRAIVQGEADTGKSTVIQAVTAKIAQEACGPSIALVVFTGGAAMNIGGKMIHSVVGFAQYF